MPKVFVIHRLPFLFRFEGNPQFYVVYPDLDC
jgi:hypothetical protein